MKGSTTTQTKIHNKKMITEQKEKQYKHTPTKHRKVEMKMEQRAIETM